MKEKMPPENVTYTFGDEADLESVIRFAREVLGMGETWIKQLKPGQMVGFARHDAAGELKYLTVRIMPKP